MADMRPDLGRRRQGMTALGLRCDAAATRVVDSQ